MGFGTRFWPALVLWLAFALGLAFVLSDAHNIQPTFAAVNVELGKVDKSRTELKRNFPQTREWGLGNAFWLALDITVPLIPFNLHDEWEPKESTEGTVNPLSPSEQLWIAPKTLANILVPVSWAIWSLIATGMAGLIRTRN